MNITEYSIVSFNLSLFFLLQFLNSQFKLPYSIKWSNLPTIRMPNPIIEWNLEYNQCKGIWRLLMMVLLRYSWIMTKLHSKLTAMEGLLTMTARGIAIIDKGDIITQTPMGHKPQLSVLPVKPHHTHNIQRR